MDNCEVTYIPQIAVPPYCYNALLQPSIPVAPYEVAPQPPMLVPLSKPIASPYSFDQTLLEENWSSSKSAMDRERFNLNILASVVEIKLMLLGTSNLGRASFIPGQQYLWESLTSPRMSLVCSMPLLQASCVDDLGTMPTMEHIVRKVYSLADKFDISIEHPCTAPVDSWLRDSGNRHWTRSLLDYSPFSCQDTQKDTQYVWGTHGEPLERWYYVKMMPPSMLYACLPLSAISDTLGNQFPLFIPLDKYHLLGLDIPCNLNDHRYILTPSYTDYLGNRLNYFGGVVVTWLGCEETVEKVDWSPLYNRSVIYVVDSSTFGGSVRTCLKCMEAVCKILNDNGCRITLCCPEL